MGTDAGDDGGDAARLGVEETGRSADRVTLAVSGELDLVTAEVLRSALERSRGEAPCVVLDLSAVDYIDSTGLVLLLEATREAAGGGWELRLLRDLSPAVTRLLEITRTESLFAWVD